MDGWMDDSTSTAHSTQHTAHGERVWWWVVVVVGSGDGLLNPEPLVLADQERITAQRPHRTGGHGPRATKKLPLILDTKILPPIAPVPVPHARVFCWQACCLLPVHRRKGRGKVRLHT